MTYHFSWSYALVTHVLATYSTCQFGRVSSRQVSPSLGVTISSEVRVIFSFLTRLISVQSEPISLGPSVEATKSSSSPSLVALPLPSQPVSPPPFTQLMLFLPADSCSFCSQQDP